MPIPPFAVPEGVSQEGINKLAKIFKPIKIKGDKAFLIKTDDLDNSFLWDADKHLKPYDGSLYTLYKFHSVHSYGYQGMFKPSITEVLQQVPKIYTMLKEVFFEVIGPEDAHDLNMWIEHVRSGVHVATTTLYLPEPTLEVMAQLYHEHPESLRMETRFTPAMSAVRWMDTMEDKERLETMRFYCRTCGKRLGSEEKPLDLGMTPPEQNYCVQCEPDPKTHKN